ncbi:MAG: YdcF family protein [Spirochaetes bacterium]|nr:YdcF family protein [Spirochaetota bacterium]
MIVILSKLISAFLLPPGVFVLLFGWVAWLLRPRPTQPTVKGPQKLPFLLSCGGAAFLYLLSTEPVSDVLLKPLEDRYTPLPAGGVEQVLTKGAFVDAVVILGGGTVTQSPEKGLDDLREEPLKRLQFGVRIYREVKKVQRLQPFLILTGGRVFDVGQEAEASLMVRYALEWGVDPGSILLDPDSRTTWQNAQNVASQFHPRRILLVTSAYHMPRAVWCFSRQGVEVVPVPTDYKVNRGVAYDLESYLPTLNGFQHSRKALHEYLGAILYRVVYR